ncbi:DUF4190 domain-containing protein [Mycobacterium sp. AMU20-3851]|uniref:DUF4190 domain-containing protein n=1 Tax=Mycobacterium sp. AMU20-3851 TaxID=3122055 RepID=UPI003753F010
MSEGPPQPAPGDPGSPVDYPADVGLPPPVYPGPPGYPVYPGLTPYPVKPPGTNGKAIAALVCALAGLPFCGVPSVAGLVFGVIAMRETGRTGQDGYGLAVAGAVIGGLTTAGLVLLALLWIGVLVSGFTLA